MPRRNRNAVTQQPTAQEPVVDIQDLVSREVTAALAEQQERRTVEVYNCKNCYKLTNNASHNQTCRTCEHWGYPPDLLTYTGRKLGYVTGIPSDLIEILSKTHTEAQIWEMPPAVLAAIWDRNSVEIFPTTYRNRGTVVGFGDYKPSPPRHRPPTAQENEDQLAQARKQKEQDVARRAAARQKHLEQNLHRATEALKQ